MSPQFRMATVLSVSMVCAGLAQGFQAPPPSGAPAAADQTFAPATKPLDARVKSPNKVTQQDLPPLPNPLVTPRPPVHHVATNPSEVPISPETFAKAQKAIERGLAFLRASPAKTGEWSPKAKAAPTNQPEKLSPVAIAITAMAYKAFVQNGVEASKDEALARALAAMLKGREPDGSFGTGNESTYITAAVASALAAAGDHDNYDQLADALQWLQNTQWDQSEGISPRQDWFGGSGYGGGSRPDVSNTQMMLDALYEAGLSPDEPAFQRALAFVSRAQNLKETNKADWAGNDGGFIYTCANGGESKASEVAGEGVAGEKLVAAGQPRSLRSYGSMTYAGFKSMLYAGLSPNDVRVRAAFDWMRNNWTFDENPGIGLLGLYYYYHTMARALFVAQQDQITDAKGGTHNWREELIDAIVSRQKDDGSWINEADRWMEGDPSLVTTYSVLALQEAIKPARE